MAIIVRLVRSLRKRSSCLLDERDVGRVRRDLFASPSKATRNKAKSSTDHAKATPSKARQGKCNLTVIFVRKFPGYLLTLYRIFVFLIPLELDQDVIVRRRTIIVENMRCRYSWHRLSTRMDSIIQPRGRVSRVCLLW